MWFIPSISLAILIQAIKFAIQNGGSLFHSLFAWCLFSSASHCNHCWGNVVSLEIAKRVGLGQLYISLFHRNASGIGKKQPAACRCWLRRLPLHAASHLACALLDLSKLKSFFFSNCSSLIINFHGSSFYMPKMPL